MKPIIEARNLGKSYVITQPGQRWSGDFADVAVEAFRRLSKGELFRKQTQERFWALKGLDFQIHPGEVVALGGPNGAGKSTLLKVLSRITTPNEGTALIRGRLGTLLEVGTGFHADLTGRENVYLSGTILGMSRQEVNQRFDEIVAFAEMETFIDTKVKRYSSGMYLRLAFSVAAHLSTEVLLIDEALAVGDVNFQRKCMGKMGQIAGQGRTVLFVSHSVSAMRNLCTRGLLLDHGRLVMDGGIEPVIQAYLAHGSKGVDSSEWVNPGNAFQHPAFQPLSMRIVRRDRSLASPEFGTPLEVHIEARIEEPIQNVNPGLMVTSPEGAQIFVTFLRDMPANENHLDKPGVVRFVVPLPERMLNEGDYRIELIARLPSYWILEAGKGNPSLPLAIRGGFGQTAYWIQRRTGIVAPEIEWQVG